MSEQPKHPRTEAQREASRRNGAKSKGPKTEEGKATSSQNAVTHGLTSVRVTIDGEQAEDWHKFLAEYLDHYQPYGPVERDTLHQLAWVAFRLQRLMPLEAAKIDAEQFKVGQHLQKVCPNYDRPLQQTMAYENSHRQIEFLGRYEGRLKRQMKDHIATLEKLQDKRKAEAKEAAEESRRSKKPNEPEKAPRFLSINQMIDAGLAPGLKPAARWNRTIDQLKEITEHLPPPKPDAA